GTIQILPDPNFGKIYRVTRADLSPGRETFQQYWSFFLQDTWQIGRKLTFRPGVRYDYQHLTGSKEFPACFEGTPRVGEVGTGARIPCEYPWKDNWGPRIGATY